MFCKDKSEYNFLFKNFPCSISIKISSAFEANHKEASMHSDILIKIYIHLEN